MLFWNTTSKFIGFSLTNPKMFVVQDTLDEKSAHDKECDHIFRCKKKEKISAHFPFSNFIHFILLHPYRTILDLY